MQTRPAVTPVPRYSGMGCADLRKGQGVPQDDT